MQTFNIIVSLSAIAQEASASAQVFSFIDEPQELGQYCSGSRGDKACVEGLKCLDNAPDRSPDQILTDGSIFTCQASAMSGEKCSKTFGDFACVEDFDCIEGNSMENEVDYRGTCEKKDAVDGSQELGQECSSSSGANACVEGLKCLDNAPDRSPDQILTDGSIFTCQASAMSGEKCSKTFGDFACVEDFDCIEGNSMENEVDYRGTCEKKDAVDGSQELGQECSSSSGANACVEGLKCLDNALDRSPNQIAIEGSTYTCQADKTSSPESNATTTRTSLYLYAGQLLALSILIICG